MKIPETFFKRELALFGKALRSPEAAAGRRLAYILKKNSECEYGRRYGFKYTATFRDFQRNIPLVRYGDIRGYLKRMAQGLPSILTTERVLAFYRTSATEGGGKIIPFTPSLKREVGSARRFWLFHLLSRFPSLLGGRFLPVFSPHTDTFLPSGIPEGANTGRIFSELSPLIRRSCPIPLDVYTLGDYEKRLYAILYYTVAEDVRFIITANPMTLLNLARSMEGWGERLIRDMEDGVAPPAGERGLTLLPARRVSGERLALLKERVKKGGLRPCAIWNISCLSLWKGGEAGLFLPLIGEYFGKLPIFDPGYSATEGFFAIPLSHEMEGGLLNIPNHFFEFIPEGVGGGEPLTFADLEEGRRYSLVITTGGGLYRYRVEDIVEVTGFTGRVPIVRFFGKEGGVVSMTGEKLSPIQASSLLKRVVKRFSPAIRFVTLVASGPGPMPHYFLALELEKGKGLERGRGKEITLFADQELMKINPEYKEKRYSGRLGRIGLKVVKGGTSLNYMRKKESMGSPSLQVKFPPLMKREDFEAWFLK